MNARPSREIADLVLRCPRWGASLGFQRMLWLCGDLAEQPWFGSLDAIRVTGSKGKGSVASMCAALLDALSIECGVYTSPHLFRPEERARVGRSTIPSSELVCAVRNAAVSAARYSERYPADPVTRFELLTAAALHWFASMRPHTLVAEAGIGGRFDPVRIVPGRIVAMTGVELEHTELLGMSLERIAYDKADLCPRGGTLIVGTLPVDLLRLLEAYCRVRGVRLVSASADFQLLQVRQEADGVRLHVRSTRLDVPELFVRASGVHQAGNVVVSLVAVCEWLHSNGLEPPRDRLVAAVRSAFASLDLPGRFQLVRADPPVYIDVAHTVASIEALAALVRTVLRDRRILLLVGVSHDKDAERIVPILAPLAEHVVCTRAHHNGRPAREVARLVRCSSSAAVEVCERIEEAVPAALRTAGDLGLTVLVAGGLFLAAEAATVLRGDDPKDLWFA